MTGPAPAGLTAVIVAEGEGYLARCPELDVASQGATVEEARANLAAAVRLLLAVAGSGEVAARRRVVSIAPLAPAGG